MRKRERQILAILINVVAQKDKKIKEAKREKEINTGDCEIRIVVVYQALVILRSESLHR